MRPAFMGFAISLVLLYAFREKSSPWVAALGVVLLIFAYFIIFQ
jgi:hypothetical protein